MDTSDNQYIVAFNGKGKGPFTLQQLQHFAKTNQITRKTPVLIQGQTEWKLAEQIPGLFSETESPSDSRPTNPGNAASRKQVFSIPEPPAPHGQNTASQPQKTNAGPVGTPVASSTVSPMPQAPMYSMPQTLMYGTQQQPMYTTPQPMYGAQQPMYGSFPQQGPYVPHPEQRMNLAPTYRPNSFLTFQNWLIGGLSLMLICSVTICILAIVLATMPEGYYDYTPEGYYDYDSYHVNQDYVECAIALTCVGLVSTVVSLIVVPAGLVFHYRCWNIIQDGYARTTPGKAIGFLFIPLFNLYWLFVSFYGLTVDMNNYLKRYGVQRYGVREKPCSQGLAMTMCILCLIPWISLFAPIFEILCLISVARVAAAIQKAKMEQTH